jgi:hypothetical protein
MQPAALHLGFDGPGAYKNKMAQAEKDELARDKMRAEHVGAVKKFRERELEMVVQEKALAGERKVLEEDLTGLKVQLAEEIMDVVAYKATLQAEFDLDCIHQKKDVEDLWLGLDDERRRRFEADMRRKDDDANMVKRLSAALQGKHDDSKGGEAFELPEKQLSAAYADALAMAWGRCGPVASMAQAVKMKAEALSSSRELDEAANKRMQTADPLKDTGLGAVIASAKKVGGTDPQAVARSDAAAALEAAVRVRRPVGLCKSNPVNP